MLKSTFVVVSLLVAAPAPAANLAAQPPIEHPNLTVEAKVVYSLTSQDPQALRDKLIEAIPMMAAHYKEQKLGLRATIVVHGEAYRFVLKNLESTPYKDDAAAKKAQVEIRVALERLVRTYGVRIEVCAAGMKKRGLDQANLYPFVHPIASASIGLIDWQQAGHALLSVE